MIPVPAAAGKSLRSAVVRSSLKQPFFTSVLLAVSFPRIHFYGLAWVALVPLLLELHRTQNWKQAFGLSYFSGFFFILLSVHWLKEVSWFGFLFVCVYQAIYFGLFGLFAKFFMGKLQTFFSRDGVMSWIGILLTLFILPASWVVSEWMRAEIPVMGFGWNLLAYSQAGNLLVIQSARLVGVYGISFLIAMINTVICMVLTVAEIRRRVWMVLFGFLLWVVNICYGGMVLKNKEVGPVMRIGVIQGNIGQQQKWDPALKNLIIEKYLKLTELSSFDGPELVVWPEAAYPDFFNEDYAASSVPSLAKKLGVPMLIGSPHRSDSLHYHNSAYLISREGKMVDRYDKIHLVPFGEYVPFKPLLSFLEPYAYTLGVGDFSFGSRYTVFEMPLGKTKEVVRFSVLICFEDIFPELARNFVRAGAQCLFVITNDAWFGKTGAPYQHLEASVFRAIENGVPVVRAGNIGVSAFISPDGKVQDSVKNERGFETYVTGALTRPVVFVRSLTFFQRVGHLFPWFCVSIVVLSFILLLQKAFLVDTITPSKSS